MKKIITVLLILLSIVNVKAYENKIIKIDIDDNYKLETKKENALRWTNENK